jgi:hypothetical protein
MLKWMGLLTTPEVQKKMARDTGLLPVVKRVPGMESYVDDPCYILFEEAIRKGRPLPRVPRWAHLEAELVRVFGKIWSELKEDPRYSPEKAVLTHLLPMAQLFDGKLYRDSFLPK